MKDNSRIINAIDKIVAKHGGVLTDKQGNKWDAGQAICRHLYGVDWNDSEEFKEANAKDELSEEVYEAAEYLANNNPSWLKK